MNGIARLNPCTPFPGNADGEWDNGLILKKYFPSDSRTHPALTVGNLPNAR